METHPMAGVYAAAVTPLKNDFSPDYEAIPILLDFLARRGCHGALILGTTGEGPSFSSIERQKIWKVSTEVREEHPNFRLFAGTGTPSLDETIGYTRIAFDLGYDGVVTLPPYYFRKASDDGLFSWYSQVIEHGTPNGGLVMGYHFPQVSGVGISLELIKRLRDKFPNEFRGLKDSSGDLLHAQKLVSTFGENFLVLVGNDRIFARALRDGVQGCITALANLRSVDLRKIWDEHQVGEVDEDAEAKVIFAREVIERYTQFPSLIKSLLAGIHDIPKWAVKPPLVPLTKEEQERALKEMMSSTIR